MKYQQEGPHYRISTTIGPFLRADPDRLSRMQSQSHFAFPAQTRIRVLAFRPIQKGTTNPFLSGFYTVISITFYCLWYHLPNDPF